jgi:hypothetical protein
MSDSSKDNPVLIQTQFQSSCSKTWTGTSKLLTSGFQWDEVLQHSIVAISPMDIKRTLNTP